MNMGATRKRRIAEIVTSRREAAHAKDSERYGDSFTAAAWAETGKPSMRVRKRMSVFFTG
jgi:hypothetical protein